jgi:hydroxymethylpyrimidine/phosphomethylpyrimidine kinase
MAVPPVVLSIAGYDPSSGAGVTADIKTAAALGCYAVTCLTSLTVQSTQGVFGVQAVAPELVSETLKALADDVEISAVRIGMLGSGEVAEAIVEFLNKRRLANIVLDPVVRSSSGAALLDEAGVSVLRTRLLPLCDVLTPNIGEAIMLAELPDSLVQSARPLADALHDLGAQAVVITAGDLAASDDFLADYRSGRVESTIFPGERIESRSTHGTGCAFATALACQLALGDELPKAVRAAKEYVRKAIHSAYPLGKGVGPVNHFG